MQLPDSSPQSPQSHLDHLFVFVMAGGSGERFWPMSRSRKPKHLLKLLNEKTLLEETLLRFCGIVPPERIFVLTNQQQIEACKDAVPWLPASQFVAEPAKRDTAPAAALATGIARKADPAAICALFPADATIHQVAEFQKNLRDASFVASQNRALLTFAISPSFPSTGFGYLKLGESLPPAPENTPTVRVDRFVEKPDEKTAEAYLASGTYAWNAGMFLWQTDIFLEECRSSAPELAAFIENFPPSDLPAYLENSFASLPKNSVDYAIMEKAKAVLAIKTSFDWDDVGTWTALPSHLPQDANNNTSRGSLASVDSRGNIVVANGRTIALCGVSDLVVVETGDAVLICHRDAVQKIKELQPQLPEELR